MNIVFYLMVVFIPNSGMSAVFVPGHYSDLQSCQTVATQIKEQYITSDYQNIAHPMCVAGNSATVQQQGQ